MTNGAYKRNYSFKMNITKEIFDFDIRNCVEVFMNFNQIKSSQFVSIVIRLIKNYKVHVYWRIFIL